MIRYGGMLSVYCSRALGSEGLQIGIGELLLIDLLLFLVRYNFYYSSFHFVKGPESAERPSQDTANLLCCWAPSCYNP